MLLCAIETYRFYAVWCLEVRHNNTGNHFRGLFLSPWYYYNRKHCLLESILFIMKTWQTHGKLSIGANEFQCFSTGIWIKPQHWAALCHNIKQHNEITLMQVELMLLHSKVIGVKSRKKVQKSQRWGRLSQKLQWVSSCRVFLFCFGLYRESDVTFDPSRAKDAPTMWQAENESRKFDSSFSRLVSLKPFLTQHWFVLWDCRIFCFDPNLIDPLIVSRLWINVSPTRHMTVSWFLSSLCILGNTRCKINRFCVLASC